MPVLTDDSTTIRMIGRNEQIAYWRYALATRSPATTEGDTETQQLKLPIPTLYHQVTELNGTIKQIIAIMNGDEGDEDGQLRPTQAALNHVSRLLMDACNAFLAQKGAAAFPRGTVSPDMDGGLRIEWDMPKGAVRLVVPPDNASPAYLFHRIDADVKTDFAVTGYDVAFWLSKGL